MSNLQPRTVKLYGQRVTLDYLAEVIADAMVVEYVQRCVDAQQRWLHRRKSHANREAVMHQGTSPSFVDYFETNDSTDDLPPHPYGQPSKTASVILSKLKLTQADVLYVFAHVPLLRTFDGTPLAHLQPFRVSFDPAARVFTYQSPDIL